MSEVLRSTDPASAETVWEGPVATAAEVARALERARAAFPEWAALSVEARTYVFHQLKAVLEQRSDTLAELISRETGKPLWESRSEVGTMIGKIDVSIAAQAERAGERHQPMLAGEAVLRHRPHGVMAVLGPYNFPGHLPNDHIVPALLAGNTVVLKPSELTPATGAMMAELWQAAGLPDGVFTVVQGGRETGAALVSGEIDGLLCTGSAATGAVLRRQFADRPHVILALELGGNNPIVTWDGDIAQTAAIIVEAAFITSGQRCSCARRLIVPQNDFGNRVVEAVTELAGRIAIGAWNDQPEPFIGPVISDRAAASAIASVDELVRRGAKPIKPLAAVAGRSAAFLDPAVIEVTGITAPDEEIFAPVLQVIRVADFAQAIAAANRTRFGLTAGLLSGDDDLWRRFLQEARAGVINRNRPTTGASGAMPFGGLGESGNHRPSAYYAADYCAYPVASFEAPSPMGGAPILAQRLQG